MKKYLILDMGRVLVEPTTGDWLITPTFLDNIDSKRIDKVNLIEAKEKCRYLLDGKAETLEEEYKIVEEFFKELFKLLEYNIPKENFENIVRDFVYNENDNKYYLYDDVKEELKRLAKKYTLLMLSDNWPCGEEYLKKHEIHKYFTKVYISSVYASRKCDKVFFDYLINDFNIKKGEALFVDDIEELLDIGVEKGLDVMLMDRNNLVKNSKYTIINSLKEL